ncbi:hypothetical protein AHAS_Ahas04G0246800 [Arachis hypogaea]
MKVYSLGIRPLQAFRLGTDRNLAENSWCNFQIGFSWKFFSHRPNSATHLASQRQPMPVCNCGPDCHNLSLSMAVRSMYEFMTPFVSKFPREAFHNYRDRDIGANPSNGTTNVDRARIYGAKFFRENFDRLVKVKTRVDPENFFRYEQSIPPQKY